MRRINQLAKIIMEEKEQGIGIYSSPTRSSKVKRVMDLAMSNEEKILKQNYGSNVENFIN